MFEDLGLKYVGPVDGHDIEARRARAAPGPGVRRPGDRARDHREGPRLRAGRARRGRPVPRRRRASTRTPACRSTAGGPTWTSVFAEEMVADRRASGPTSSAITAAMLHPVRPGRGSPSASPSRVFDVGIAEQHAATSAAGMAFGGLHPVVAVYATFLNRAFDQVLMDCRAAQGRRHVRARPRRGHRRRTAPSHNGMWDLSLLQVVPGLRIAAPRDAATLRAELREAVAVDDAPDRGALPQGRGAAGPPGARAASAAWTCCAATRRRRRAPRRRRRDGAASPRGRRPAGRPGHRRHRRRPALGQAGRRRARRRWRPRHRLVVTVEDNGRVGGVGSAARPGAARRRRAHAGARLRHPAARSSTTAAAAEVLADIGLTAQDISRGVVEAAAGLTATQLEDWGTSPTG